MGILGMSISLGNGNRMMLPIEYSNELIRK